MLQRMSAALHIEPVVVRIRTGPVQLWDVYLGEDMVTVTGVGVLLYMYMDMVSALELEREQDVERQLSQWCDMGLTQMQEQEWVQHQQWYTPAGEC